MDRDEEFIQGMIDLVFKPLATVHKRRVIANEMAGDLRISTIFAADIEKFETAIEDAARIIPVERYETGEQALAGHKKWIDLAPTLTKVMMLGLGPVPDQVVFIKHHDWWTATKKDVQ